MAYSTDTNNEITEFISLAQSWLGAKATDLSKKVANKKPASTYMEDVKLGFMVDSFIRALDNQQNNWTEKEIVQYIQYWSATLGLKKYPYVQREAYNLNVEIEEPEEDNPLLTRVQSVVSSATVTANINDYDMVIVTAQAEALTLANPIGTPTEGQGLVYRIKDNGTPQSISYGDEIREIGVTSPITTVASKTLYLALVRNAADSKWDLIGVIQQA